MFGLGTGGCGLQHLHHLLSGGNEDTFLTLNAMGATWEGSLPPLRQFYLRGHEISGDLCPAWLPHVEALRAQVPNVRFVCLQNTREDTIRALGAKFSTHRRALNPFGQAGVPRFPLDRYPKYQGVGREEAIGLFWDEYYTRAARLAGPDFEVFETGDLFTEEGRQRIRGFVRG